MPFHYHHPCGLNIHAGLTKKEIISAGIPTEVRDMGNGYAWFKLPAITEDGYSIIFQLCFAGDSLHSLQIYDSSAKYGTSWSDHSRSKEEARAASTRAWLEKAHTQHPGLHPEKIHCAYDEKSGAGYCSYSFTISNK